MSFPRMLSNLESADRRSNVPAAGNEYRNLFADCGARGQGIVESANPQNCMIYIPVRTCPAVRIRKYCCHYTAIQLAKRDLLSHLGHRAKTDSTRTSTRHNEPGRRGQIFLWRIFSVYI
ncbi:unnamed protein product [Tuber aestivum]|uniref:Uncharacterized protein n=1 Tax=Tuber aestivum TaxID=59557 RepID=A0A292PVW9_9PEZI|nr:unnamed protein product [Tuber aestivum]